MSFRRVAFLSLAVGVVACSAAQEVASESGAASTVDPASVESVAPPGCVVPVDPSRSLFVTDSSVLARFTLERVLEALVASAGSNQTPLGVYQQWWDTNNKARPAVGGRSGAMGGHCDDDGGLLNGFPIDCPRQEGTLTNTNPFVAGPDHYSAIGVVNRFDLAPSNGANCGQYRVVFGKDSGLSSGSDRNLVIFEAVLPNPNPSRGIDGCFPVAQFWDHLSTAADAGSGSLADALDGFFFTGLSGFEPVITADHYGAKGGSDTGQIRANQFMNGVSYLGGPALHQDWQLREYRLQRATNVAAPNNLVIRLDSVKNDPSPSLIAGADPLSTQFQTAFLAQVASLAAPDTNLIAMATAPQFNAGQSREQSPADNYERAGASAAFLGQIAARIPASDAGLLPGHILARATTQSCQGCHIGENNGDLGGGLRWPNNDNGFVQITEHSRLSAALTGTFLPFRKHVLETFVAARCVPHTQTAGDPATTISGGKVGAAN